MFGLRQNTFLKITACLYPVTREHKAQHTNGFLNEGEIFWVFLTYFLRSNFSSFPQYFHISLTSRDQLHINLLNVVVRITFSSILKIWYVEVRISRSVSEGPLEFEITRVDCTCITTFWTKKKHASSGAMIKHVQSTLLISTSLISNNSLSRSENQVPV